MIREQESLPAACFAPPLTDDLLRAYRILADALPDSRGDVRDALRECLKAVETWWGLPESKGNARHDGHLLLVHRKEERLVRITGLSETLKKELWDSIPWDYEIAAMEKLFESISNETGRELRDAAFHLLWHVRELSLDREPLTQDALK